jgi:hypothetical protein
MRFIVTEVVEYEVEAKDEAEAVKKVADNIRRDDWCIRIADRYAVEAPQSTSQLAPKLKKLPPYSAPDTISKSASQLTSKPKK